MTTAFSCLAFDELSLRQLYDVMVLRQEVFVVEQRCPYQDADGKDLRAWHVLGFEDEGSLVAYARILPCGVSYPDHASIGRVVSSPDRRRTGSGRQLMAATLDHLARLLPDDPVKISAQSYLQRFYESFGFRVVGDEYLEDDIPHLPMVKDRQWTRSFGT